MDYGSEILDQVVSERKRRGAFLTVESVDGKGAEYRQRYDRRRFYRRNGWRQTGTTLLTTGANMDVYEIDSSLSQEEILGVVNRFYEIIG